MAAEGKVIACHNREELTEIQYATEPRKLMVIDFTRTGDTKCDYITPIFAKLAEELVDVVVFISVDVDESNTLAQDFQVQALPTFIFMKGGGIVDTMVGDDKEKLIIKIMYHRYYAA